MDQDNTNNTTIEKKARNRKQLIIIAIVVIVLGVFGSIFFKRSPEMVTREYGAKLHQVTFDKNNISQEEVDYLADGLAKANFFDNMVTKYVYIKKDHSTCYITISSNPLITGNPTAMAAFVALRDDMQKQFPKNKIVIDLATFNFNNLIKRIE